MASEEFNDLIKKVQSLEWEVKKLHTERNDLNYKLEESQRARGRAERAEADALRHEEMAVKAYEGEYLKVQLLSGALAQIQTERKAKESRKIAENALASLIDTLKAGNQLRKDLNE